MLRVVTPIHCPNIMTFSCSVITVNVVFVKKVAGFHFNVES